MENSANINSIELVKAIKDNLLEPMYNGINENTNQMKNELKKELFEKLKEIDDKLNVINERYEDFVEAIKSVKWDF